VQREGDSKRGKKRPKARYVSDLKKVFTEPFINKMMANMHLKIYDFSATEK
jgi:ABC-type transporter MlaC component